MLQNLVGNYLQIWGGDFATPPTYQVLNIFMSNEALKDIQKALNTIRSVADKERLEGKIKALELMTQALQSHITGIKAAAVVGVGIKKQAQRKLPKPPQLPIPKSLNTPSSANNPNDVIPNEPRSPSNDEQQPLN